MRGIADLMLDRSPDLEFGPCFVAYFDILGWSELIRSKRGDEVANKIFGALLRIYTARQLVKEGHELIALGATVDVGRTLTASFFSDSIVYSCATEADEAAWLADRVRLTCIELLAELRSYLTGWKQYFRLADTPREFLTLDKWIRHRLRALQLKQWRRGRTIYRELLARGLSARKAAKVAAQGRRWFRTSSKDIHIALPISYFDALGIPRVSS